MLKVVKKQNYTSGHGPSTHPYFPMTAYVMWACHYASVLLQYVLQHVNEKMNRIFIFNITINANTIIELLSYLE